MPTKKKTTVSAARSRFKTPVRSHAPQPDPSSASPTAPPSPPPQRTPEEHAVIDAWRRRGRAIPHVVLRETGGQRELHLMQKDEALAAAQLADLFKTDDSQLLAHLLTQVSRCVWKTEAA
jgi:hypothetical protein